MSHENTPVPVCPSSVLPCTSSSSCTATCLPPIPTPMPRASGSTQTFLETVSFLRIFYQDTQIAALLFPAVIAASPVDHPKDAAGAGAGQKSTLDCLLDTALENFADIKMEELLLNLVKVVEISQDEEKLMQEVCATLKSVLVNHFPKAVLEPFGSIPR